MELWKLLADIVMLLAACLVFGGLASRVGQSPLVGYLIAGMSLGGPGSLGLVTSQSEIEAIAELGVALLLFNLGLEFSIDRLKALGTTPLLGGVVQVTVTIVTAAGIALLFGATPRGATALGAMVSLSSTAVVLRILMEQAELEAPHGRSSLGVLLTQDMAVVPLAILMTILGGDGTATEIAADIGRLLLMAAMLSLALYVLNQIALLALGSLMLYRNRELTVIFATVTGLGSAWAAHYAGISPALGAFLAGMLLGSSAFAIQIRADISSLRVVLLTLFFGAAGMVADPIWIAGNWYIVTAVVAALTVGKLLIISTIFLLLGQSLRVAAATGLCLAQVGEFAFVLGSVGRSSGVVTEDMYALVVSATIVSFFLSAFLVPRAPAFGHRVAKWWRSAQEFHDRPAVEAVAPDVVVVGFGPAGQLATRPFADSPRRVVVIDLNYQGVERARRQGFQGQLGDATQSEVLEHAQVQHAKLIVITVPHHRSAILILQLIRDLNPHVTVVARSRYEIQSGDLAAAGAEVVGDEQEVGEAIAARIGRWLEENPA